MCSTPARWGRLVSVAATELNLLGGMQLEWASGCFEGVVWRTASTYAALGAITTFGRAMTASVHEVALVRLTLCRCSFLLDLMTTELVAHR
jgi:hypothetical protein